MRLLTLGRLALVNDGGAEEESLAGQRRKLALLTVLASSRRRRSRDDLVEMFWGDQPTKRGRHSLSNALSHLRGILGPNSILPHRDQIGLEPGVLTWDGDLFAAAVAEGRRRDALELWQGPFLDGIHVDGSPTFEPWADAERARLNALLLQLIEAELPALRAAGDWEGVARLGAKWLDVEPLSVPAATTLFEALSALGTRESDQRAVEAYQRLVIRLKRLRRRPDRAVVGRVRAAVDRLGPGKAPGGMVIPPELLEPEGGGTVEAAPFPPPRRPGEGWLGWLVARLRRPAVFLSLGVAAAVVLGAGWYLNRRPARTHRGDLVQVVAVGAVRAGPDTATAWLADGIPEMVVARLARSDRLGLVTLRRLREYLPSRSPTLDDLLGAARRLGATWALSGAVTRSEQGYVMDVNVHDVRSGTLVTVATVSAPDPVALADLAAARLLEAAGVTTAGRLAELETADPAAFRALVRSRQRSGSDGAVADLDEAIRIDSGFVSAVVERAGLAFERGERDVLPRLLALFERNRARATPWDRDHLEAEIAFFGGEHDRADSLARELVRRHPDDLRAVSWFIRVFTAHARWAEADSLLVRRLAEIRGAELPARGGCAACGFLASRFELLASQGDTTGMELVARELLRLRPDGAVGWVDLATAFAFEHREDQAVVAARRAVALDPSTALGLGRLLVAAGKLSEADSLVRAMAADPGADAVVARLDLSAALSRERGRWRAAIAALDSLDRLGVPDARLLAADSYARIGDLRRASARAAARVPAEPAPIDGVPGAALDPDGAPTFAWHRAIEADLLASAGDTVRLAGLIDSVERIGARSHRARDWRIHHHLRGRLAAIRGDHIEAIRGYEAAWLGPSGWTRTDLAWAASLRAAGRSAAALGVLRRAYLNDQDGISRLVPRSELDLAMAVTFRAVGQGDSATVYFDRVEAAYRGADPEALLALAAARR